MEISLDDLATDPSLLLYEIDFQRQVALFFKVSPATPNTHCSLATEKPPVITVPIDILVNQSEILNTPLPKPINFIWMTDFCGSTLYARALNEVKGIYLYNETHLFRDIANAKRFSGKGFPQITDKKWKNILKLAMFYQSKTFIDDDIALVKEFPATNYIINDILGMDDTFRGIFLYASLEEYLIACLKQPSRRRLARNRLTRVFHEKKEITALRHTDPAYLSDAQVVTLHWLYLMYWHQTQNLNNNQKLKTLFNKDFYSSPGIVLQRSAEHFNNILNDDAAHSITQGHVFNKHSKDASKSFSMEEHEAALATARSHFTAEVEEGLAWARTITDRFPLQQPLETGLM